ncbi:MAG: tetratricopeptide repeat protein [Acidobacteriota bacterium]
MRNPHKQAFTKSARSGMVLFLFIVFLLMQSPLTAIAQTAQNDGLEEAKRLNAEALKLYNAGRYDEAIPLAERVLAIVEKSLGKDHPEVATAINNLAAMYKEKGDYAKAEPLYIRALVIYEEALGEDHPLVATTLDNLALLHQAKGEYAKAEPLHIRALAISEKALGSEHPDVAIALGNLAGLYNTKGDYSKAEPLFIRALAIVEKAFGKDHPSVATALNNLAALYETKGDYAKAEPLYTKALAIYERTLGTEHPLVANALNNLALLYKEKGDYAKAEPLYVRALAIREKAFGAEHPYVATTLSNLAGLYNTKGDYSKAEPLYIRALAIDEKTLGEEHPSVAASLSNLAGLYKEKGDYTKAEPLYVRALAIYEKTFGAEHPYVATTLSNLAALYKEKGDYAKAEPRFIRALAIKEKVLGKDHPSVATSLNNLAELYRAKGDYSKAEPLYTRASTISEKALGSNHPDVAISLGNLAGLYQAKGDYSKAEPLYTRASAILEKALGAEHSLVATSLGNLAGMYQAKGDYAKAEPLYIRALVILEKALGADHSLVATYLNNLALLYCSKGDCAKAEPFYTKALTISEKALGAEHSLVAIALNNLAATYKEKGDYARAEPLYTRALAIYEEVFGAEHFLIATTLNNLAELYRAKGNYAKAIEVQTRANETDERDLILNLVSGSERQKIAYLNQTSHRVDLTLSLHIQFAPNNIDARRAAVAILLRRKGRALDAMTDSISNLRRRASPEDQALLDQLALARSQHSNLINRGAGPEGFERYRANLKAIEEREEQIENSISRRSTDFRAQLLPVTFTDVQRAVPTDAALVEFAAYRPYDAKTRKFGASRYAAYVLTNQGEPSHVDLGEAATIDKLIADWRNVLRKGTSDIEREVKPLARQIDERVMRPVRTLIGKTRRLLLSPDGLLNLIPFDVLVDENNRYLVETYSLSYLTSGRDLLRLQSPKQSSQTALVFADPDFNNAATSKAGASSNSAAAQKSNSASADSLAQRTKAVTGPRLGNAQLEPLYQLSGSAEEGMELKKILTSATVLMKAEATESALKGASSPSILHISTHGAFLEDEPKPEPDSATKRGLFIRPAGSNSFNEALPQNLNIENPLLRAGLFFAGANRGRSGEDDGVLTALEATGLDLYGTKMVVLSACDTGVGEVKNGDGVYGLRRAFALAGAETQMMSLWPVSDIGTRELMIEYYKRLRAGEGRGEALRQVRLKMLANKDRKHPFFWASFIQSGEWANLDGKR